MNLHNKFKVLIYFCAILLSAEIQAANIVNLEYYQNNSGKLELLESSLPLEAHSYLELVTTKILPDKSIKMKYIQKYNDVYIKNSIVTVSVTDNSHNYNEISGNIVNQLDGDLPNKNDILTIENIKSNVIASKELTPSEIQSLNVKLLIEVDGGNAGYIYKINYLTITPEIHRPFIIYDASSGELLREWDAINNIKTTSTVNAHGIGGNKKTGVYTYGVDYPTLKVFKEGELCRLENDNVRTVDMEHSWSLKNNGRVFNYQCSDTFNTNNNRYINGAYSAMNDAHYFGGVVYKMYKQWANTAPLPFKLIMRVHFGQEFENAFWDGKAMTFGDGENEFYPLVDINVSAHEISHGFTETNSNLEYVNQSGGINEAFSDIAGEAAEYFMKNKVDWAVGSDIFKGEGALRYFDNPTKDGHSIEHVDSYTDGMNVHLSSGIFNKAFYLLVNQHQWSIVNAFQVFTLANQIYWNENSTFDYAACGVKRAAKDLSLDQRAVIDAFYQVGVNAICPISASVKVLESDVPENEIDGKKNEDFYFSITVPEGVSKLDINLNRLSGSSYNDADLYVSYDEKPTSIKADCSSRGSSSEESCFITAPKAGIYLILVHGYFDFEGYSLIASIQS
ncbi:Zinc metalloprotease (elastase) [Shewanella psychrophila]|uniref:Neutral metalloproteinase n=1 Tax=Shewanella psychrophila TaxID=225848 RepID=A0A1S6HSM3_9GAMM|nr:M4 family metallopeptidase [Shewanella psychrophila]AQS38540.1 Zinc metalloprotease (elastase) [Shewanella psychrophila]